MNDTNSNNAITPSRPSRAGSVPGRSIESRLAASSCQLRFPTHRVTSPPIGLAAPAATRRTMPSTARFRMSLAPENSQRHASTLVRSRKELPDVTLAPRSAQALQAESQLGTARPVAASQRANRTRSRGSWAKACQPGNRERGPVVRRR